jgi:hypothetical protein
MVSRNVCPQGTSGPALPQVSRSLTINGGSKDGLRAHGIATRMTRPALPAPRRASDTGYPGQYCTFGLTQKIGQLNRCQGRLSLGEIARANVLFNSQQATLMG